MKFFLFATAMCLFSCTNSKKASITPPPAFLGNFEDDYSIRYTISDSLFTQHPNVKYHILFWNTKEKFIIAKNDNENPSEQNLYTRIDYMYFENMQPFTRGFCFTKFDAPDLASAERAVPADRNNPKKGCGGFPFSRLKRIP